MSMSQKVKGQNYEFWRSEIGMAANFAFMTKGGKIGILPWVLTVLHLPIDAGLGDQLHIPMKNAINYCLIGLSNWGP